MMVMVMVMVMMIFCIITFSADGSFKEKASSCKEHLGHAMLNVRVTQWSPMSFAPFNVDALPVPNGTGWIYHFGWQMMRLGGDLQQSQIQVI